MEEQHLPSPLLFALYQALTCSMIRLPVVEIQIKYYSVLLKGPTCVIFCLKNPYCY